MTKSIKTDDSGVVQTVYNGVQSGGGWVQISDSEWPEVMEDDVAVEYHYDGNSVSVSTTTIPDDDLL